LKANSKAKLKQGKKTPPVPQHPHKATFLKKSHFKRNLAVLAAVIFLVVIGLYSFSQTSAGSSARPIQVLNSNWKSASLTNAVTGQTFTLSQYAGKVVVLQFMATYCQYCLAEGHQLVSVQQSLSGNSQASGQVVMISVDVDPNENLAQLKNYVQQNNFGAASSSPSWIYAMDTSGQLLKSVVGNVDFGSFISLANLYFVNQQQSDSFLSLQRSSFQDASPASDIIAVVNKLL
jgi:thiol-disulfide isomerase/thioredoxin